MYAYRCDGCEKLHYPARLVCDRCHGRSFTKEYFCKFGRLLTYTTVYNLPPGIDQYPVKFGIVQMNDGICVTGQMDTVDLPAAGMPLEATVGTVRTLGETAYQGFIFKKIR